MFEVGVVAQFEAAHRLRGDFGPATRLHGHTYRVEVVIRAPAVHEDGTLCDIGRLQQAVQEAVSSLHYQTLDEHPAFAQQNSTAELVARYLFQELSPHFKGWGLASLSVRVWESPQAYAGYEGELS